jgi:hypothetical protein
VLFKVGYAGGEPFDYLYAPYVNIYKSFSMTSSQVTALLGYQLNPPVEKSSRAVFFVLLTLGLAAFVFGILALIKFFKAKKLTDVTS